MRWLYPWTDWVEQQWQSAKPQVNKRSHIWKKDNSPEDEQSILFKTSRPNRLFSEPRLHMVVHASLLLFIVYSYSHILFNQSLFSKIITNIIKKRRLYAAAHGPISWLWLLPNSECTITILCLQYRASGELLHKNNPCTKEQSNVSNEPDIFDEMSPT